jgi:16S rRNA (cytosine967-C5)-methyltransferase
MSGRLSAERRLAGQLLLRVDESGGRLDRWLADGARALSEQEARRARALVYGVLRQRTRLARRLEPMLKRPFAEQDPEVQVALLLGAFELLHLGGVPPRAAVDQAVEQARALHAESRTGLVNAVLRKLAGPGAPAERLPERGADPLGWAEAACSMPRWIVDELAAQLGAVEAAAACEAFQQEAKLALRFLPLGGPDGAADDGSDARTREALHALPGASAGRLGDPQAILLLGAAGGGIAALPGMAEGRVQVQDEAAQAVVSLLGLRPGDRVLDACAAPGGKAVAAAQLVGPAGHVVALDRDAERLRLLEQAPARLARPWLVPMQRDLLAEPWGARAGDRAGDGGGVALTFDAVLLDAPCSATGVLRRHPDVRWTRREADLSGHAARQLALLESLAPAVAPGGCLVYAVCSFARAETGEVVRAFLASESARRLRIRLDERPAMTHPVSMELLDGPFLRTWPHRHDSDGFFAARFVREGSARP